MEGYMAKKHEVIIVGMGLASLAAAARLNELGVKDILTGTPSGNIMMI